MKQKDFFFQFQSFTVLEWHTELHFDMSEVWAFCRVISNISLANLTDCDCFFFSIQRLLGLVKWISIHSYSKINLVLSDSLVVFHTIFFNDDIKVKRWYLTFTPLKKKESTLLDVCLKNWMITFEWGYKKAFIQLTLPWRSF